MSTESQPLANSSAELWQLNGLTHADTVSASAICTWLQQSSNKLSFVDSSSRDIAAMGGLFDRQQTLLIRLSSQLSELHAAGRVQSHDSRQRMSAARQLQLNSLSIGKRYSQQSNPDEASLYNRLTLHRTTVTGSASSPRSRRLTEVLLGRHPFGAANVYAGARSMYNCIQELRKLLETNKLILETVDRRRIAVRASSSQSAVAGASQKAGLRLRTTNEPALSNSQITKLVQVNEDHPELIMSQPSRRIAAASTLMSDLPVVGAMMSPLCRQLLERSGTPGTGRVQVLQPLDICRLAFHRFFRVVKWQRDVLRHKCFRTTSLDASPAPPSTTTVRGTCELQDLSGLGQALIQELTDKISCVELLDQKVMTMLSEKPVDDAALVQQIRSSRSTRRRTALRAKLQQARHKAEIKLEKRHLQVLEYMLFYLDASMLINGDALEQLILLHHAARQTWRPVSIGGVHADIASDFKIEFPILTQSQIVTTAKSWGVVLSTAEIRHCQLSMSISLAVMQHRQFSRHQVVNDNSTGFRAGANHARSFWSQNSEANSGEARHPPREEALFNVGDADLALILGNTVAISRVAYGVTGNVLVVDTATQVSGRKSQASKLRISLTSVQPPPACSDALFALWLRRRWLQSKQQCWWERILVRTKLWLLRLRNHFISNTQACLPGQLGAEDAAPRASTQSSSRHDPDFQVKPHPEQADTFEEVLRCFDAHQELRLLIRTHKCPTATKSPKIGVHGTAPSSHSTTLRRNARFVIDLDVDGGGDAYERLTTSHNDFRGLIALKATQALASMDDEDDSNSESSGSSGIAADWNTGDAGTLGDGAQDDKSQLRAFPSTASQQPRRGSVLGRHRWVVLGADELGGQAHSRNTNSSHRRNPTAQEQQTREASSTSTPNHTFADPEDQRITFKLSVEARTGMPGPPDGCPDPARYNDSV